MGFWIGWMVGAPCLTRVLKTGTRFLLRSIPTICPGPGVIKRETVLDTTRTCSKRVCATPSYNPDPKYMQDVDVTGAVFSITPGETVPIRSVSCYESVLASVMISSGHCAEALCAWSPARDSTAGFVYRRSSLALYLRLIENLPNFAKIGNNGLVDGIVPTTLDRIATL
jgi:hypothetical protein